MVSKKPELLQRLVFGSLTLGVVFVFIGLSMNLWFRPFFLLGLSLLVFGCIWEYLHLAKRCGAPVLSYLAPALGFIFLWTRYLQMIGVCQIPSSVVLGGMIATLFVVTLFFPSHGLVQVAVSSFGLLYVAVPLSLICDLLWGFSQDGRVIVLFLIVITVLTDMGGYFIGKRFGKHRIASSLSPKKSWEGALGGFLFALIGAWIFSRFSDFSPLTALLWGFLIAFAGQIGDFCESVLKRSAAVKDSNKIPGLGGLLDMVDSLLFSVPLVFVLQTFGS